MDSLASVTDVIDNKKRPAARPDSLYLLEKLDSHPTVTLYHRLWGYGAASVTVLIVSFSFVIVGVSVLLGETLGYNKNYKKFLTS
jgi:hypothetical protein